MGTCFLSRLKSVLQPCCWSGRGLVYRSACETESGMLVGVRGVDLGGAGWVVQVLCLPCSGVY